MSPALAQSPRTEGDQNSNGKHPSIALCLGGGTVEERADTGILVVNEVPVEEGLARLEKEFHRHNVLTLNPP